MTDYVVIEGVKPWDGRYEFSIGDVEFTTREWGFIKRLSGYLPLTFFDGLEGVDPELIAVFAAIALRRAGKIDERQVPEIFERLLDEPFGKIRLEFAKREPEDDSSPPTKSSSENGDSSGADSRPSLANWELSPRPTGTPGSDTSASPSARSAS